MKTKTKLVLAAAIVACVTTATTIIAVWPSKLHGETLTVATSTPATPQLSYQQQAWLGALEWCESQGKPTAVNPKDSDGTPSYGLLQFKPGSYAYFASLYGLASTTNYRDPDEQEQIVTDMILSGKVNLHGQFPACTTKLGLPPVGTTTDSVRY